MKYREITVVHELKLRIDEMGNTTVVSDNTYVKDDNTAKEHVLVGVVEITESEAYSGIMLLSKLRYKNSGRRAEGRILRNGQEIQVIANNKIYEAKVHNSSPNRVDRLSKMFRENGIVSGSSVGVQLNLQEGILYIVGVK